MKKQPSAGIFLGRFQDICAEFEDGSIDAIVTDPPYPAEFLPLWTDLSRTAGRLLKPSGFCICYSGKFHLPEVIDRLSEHLEYYWQFILNQTGPWAGVHPVKINTRYKPILVFQKPPHKAQERYIFDLVHSPGRDKRYHRWQQAIEGFEFMIESFTKENDLVLDPFLGSGTTAVACNMLGRRCIGIECDPETYKTAVDRIKSDTQQYLNIVEAAV